MEGRQEGQQETTLKLIRNLQNFQNVSFEKAAEMLGVSGELLESVKKLNRTICHTTKIPESSKWNRMFPKQRQHPKANSHGRIVFQNLPLLLEVGGENISLMKTYPPFAKGLYPSHKSMPMNQGRI